MRFFTDLPYRIAEEFVQGMPDLTWEDARDLVNDCRAILSSDEIACTREAAKIADAMIMSATAYYHSILEVYSPLHA